MESTTMTIPEDIEDIKVSNEDDARPGGAGGVGIVSNALNNVRRQRRQRRRKKRGEERNVDGGDLAAASDDKVTVPGTQKVWVKTYGCSHNVSDSEFMQGQLDAYGYTLTDRKEDADVWLINSCTVKDPSQAVFMNLVKKGRAEDKSVVVAGCVPQGDKKVKGLEGVSVVGVHNIDRVVEVVEETLKGNTVVMTDTKKKLPRLDLPKIRRDPLVEIIPLSTGCLGSCTYCKTKHARGVLGSYAPQAIVERARTAIKEGVKEIWLSSEDTGAYGRDIGETLPKLLNRLVRLLEKTPDVMLRVGMTNPPFILDHLDEIADVLIHPQVYAWLHVPVQAGSNSVLLKMNREYTIEEFERVADFLTSRVDDFVVATDIIVGFPGESEKDFEATMRLVRKYRFSILNISQFYPRPGTPAAKMKRVDTKIVKGRSRRLTALFESFDPYAALVGRKRQRVWVSNEVSKSNHSVAHDKSYRKVLLPRDDKMKGTSVLVDYVSSARFHIVAKRSGVAGVGDSKIGESSAPASAVDVKRPGTYMFWRLALRVMFLVAIFAYIAYRGTEEQGGATEL
eukprot:g736.t1